MPHKWNCTASIPALMWYGKTFSPLPLVLWTVSAGFLGVFYMYYMGHNCIEP